MGGQRVNGTFMVLEGLNQARLDGRKNKRGIMSGLGKHAQRELESFGTPERRVKMGKFWGDRIAEGLEWQSEELGPCFQSGSGSVGML